MESNNPPLVRSLSPPAKHLTQLVTSKAGVLGTVSMFPVSPEMGVDQFLNANDVLVCGLRNSHIRSVPELPNQDFQDRGPRICSHALYSLRTTDTWHGLMISIFIKAILCQ